MTKIEGPGSGSGSESESMSQRHGSADPDPNPPKNIMDPQHWSSNNLLSLKIGVSVAAVMNKQKYLGKNLIFWWHLETTEEKTGSGV
jgi:hypothetical protein